MAQIKINNFDFEVDKNSSDNEYYKLLIDFEFVVSKVELLEPKKYLVQFSIGGNEDNNRKFKMLGCEIPITVSINDYRNDFTFHRLIDEEGRLHYHLQHFCNNISAHDLEINGLIHRIDSVFVMADLYTADNHLLLGFTGSAGKSFSQFLHSH